MLQAVLGLIDVYVLYRPHVRTPIQNKIHILLGWLTWGLSVANIPVGMVLYGSPRYLFALFAVLGGFWALLILVFEIVGGKQYNHVRAEDYDTPPNWNGQIHGRAILDKRLTSHSS